MEEKEIREIQALDRVVKTTIRTMEVSKEQIFDIAESARLEGGNLKRELDQLKVQVDEIIKNHDRLELKYRHTRRRLMEVSRDFHQYSEEDIRKVYEAANEIHIELRLAREREQYLRNRRDELQLRLKNLERTLEKAENLMTQISLVLGYLRGDIARMTEVLEMAKHGQMFGFRIIQAQEEERKRVAREIHDGPAQSMANVVLRADIVEKMLSQKRIEQAKDELKDLKRLVRDSLGDVRKIIYDLRPMALDDLGLIPTLKKFIDDYTRNIGLEIDFKMFGSEDRLPSAMEVAIFRLIQESLNNVTKHAKATRVKIVIDISDVVVHVSVIDNGVGFEVGESVSSTQFGLMGMRERVRLLEGEIEIKSKPGKGTEVYVQIPLSVTEEEVIDEEMVEEF